MSKACMRELLTATTETSLLHVAPQLLIKDETDNPSNCFKLRSMLLVTNSSTGGRKYVTASSGNTGVALGIAASAQGHRAEVWMNKDASPARVRRVERTGAQVHLLSGNFDRLAAAALSSAQKQQASFISPGVAGPFVAGHEAIFREIQEQLPGPKMVFVPAGGGGLLTAAIRVLLTDNNRDEIAVIGVQALASRPIFELFHGRLTGSTPVHASYAECLSGGLEEDAAIFAEVSRVDDIQLVTREELSSATAYLEARVGIVAEPGGAAGLAAALRYQEQNSADSRPKVAILTGRSQEPRRLCGA